MESKTVKIVKTAIIAALVCVATMFRIPSPLKGYINLGDCMVLLAGYTLSPLYGFFAAAIGSALTDVFAGYIVYAPATFIIKGIMAVCAGFLSKFLCQTAGRLASQITGGIVAEAIMVAGYYVFEGFLYGFIPSAINIPANAVQGIAGIVLGTVVTKIFKKSGIL